MTLFFKKDIYHAKIKNTEDKIPGVTNLATNITFNAKIDQVKKEISISFFLHLF